MYHLLSRYHLLQYDTFFSILHAISFRTLKISTSAPCRASVRTATVWTLWAASNAPARREWFWKGTGVSVSYRPPLVFLPSLLLTSNRSPSRCFCMLFFFCMTLCRVSGWARSLLPDGVWVQGLRACAAQIPHPGHVLLHGGQSLGPQLWTMSSGGHRWVEAARSPYRPREGPRCYQ